MVLDSLFPGVSEKLERLLVCFLDVLLGAPVIEASSARCRKDYDNAFKTGTHLFAGVAMKVNERRRARQQTASRGSQHGCNTADPGNRYIGCIGVHGGKGLHLRNDLTFFPDIRRGGNRSDL